MEELLKKIRAKAHVALSLPALLCFTQFIINIIASVNDGKIDSNELHQLLSSADGFETVFLVIIMLLLKGK